MQNCPRSAVNPWQPYVSHMWSRNTSVIQNRTSPVLHWCFTGTSLVPHRYFTGTSRVLHGYPTSTSQVPHRHFTGTSPVLQRYFTDTYGLFIGHRWKSLV